MKNKMCEINDICPNYYKIVNSTILEGDVVSEKVLKIYTEYVCNSVIESKEDIDKLKKIDNIVYQYLIDNNLKKEVSFKITRFKIQSKVSNIVEYVVNVIIKIFDDYLFESTRNLYIPRWI